MRSYSGYRFQSYPLHYYRPRQDRKQLGGSRSPHRVGQVTKARERSLGVALVQAQRQGRHLRSRPRRVEGGGLCVGRRGLIELFTALEHAPDLATYLDEDTELLLAVKPQIFPEAATEAATLLDTSRVVISIIAGLPSARLSDALGPGARVIRAMPNTPARVRRCMAAIALGQGAIEGDERLAFIDIDTPMLGDDGKPRAELFIKDGLHLSDAGYKIWSDLVRPHLAERED